MAEYKEGQYAAVFFEDNSTGDHDKCYSIAIWKKHFDDSPCWRHYETMQKIIGPYEGDRILRIWLLDRPLAEFDYLLVCEDGEPCKAGCIRMHTKCSTCGRWGARGEITGKPS